MSEGTTSACPGSEDQRFARRTPTRIGAQIIHPSLAAPLACTVRDTSSTGARLELGVIRGGQISRDRAPDRFTLFIQPERLYVDCEVAWREGTLIGVRYVSPTRRAPKLERPTIREVKKPGSKLLAKLINPL